MTTIRKHFTRPGFLPADTQGDDAAAALRRIVGTKPDSHSATAMVFSYAGLWDEKVAQSQANADNASKPRKGLDVTADQIEQARRRYRAQYGTERGFWTKTAPELFGLGARTVKRRWKEEFGTATAKDK